MSTIASAEFALLEDIRAFACGSLPMPWTDELLRWASRVGNGGLVWVAVGAALLLLPKTRRGGEALLAALLVGFALNNWVLKLLFERPRPCQIAEGFSLIYCPPDPSFPSGHAASAFAAAAALAAFHPKLGAAALAFAGIEAFSRLYLGVHFPTDVLAGAAVGFASAAAVAAVMKRRGRRCGGSAPSA